MNSEDINSYLSNIEESLFDEKRIVTYTWLSKTFGIHCNFSKQLLYSFFENSPKKEELSVTYLLIGQPKDGSGCRVFIVKDKDLREAETNLKLITSKHIYSIQKCQDLSDINVLYTPPNESVDGISKGISAVDFSFKERDSTLIAKLRQDALPATPVPPAPTVKKTSVQSVAKTKSPSKNVNNEESGQGKNNEKQIDSKPDNKKSVFPSMFNNNTAGPKKKAAEKAPANSKKPQGIGAFFTKAANKPSPTNEPKKVPENNEAKKKEDIDSKEKERLSPLKENKATLNICTEPKSKNKIEESLKDTVIKTKKAETKSKATSKKTLNKSGKKKAAKKDGIETKKRKRLVVLSDSDSSGESEVEEEIPREPTPEPQPTFVPDEEMDDIILGTPEPSQKRKKRKLVSRTYACPDGFMITKKHYEEVSASEEEEVVPEKKFKSDSPQDSNNEKNAEKSKDKTVTVKIKSPSPQKTKQSSLMSFFKKK